MKRLALAVAAATALACTAGAAATASPPTLSWPVAGEVVLTFGAHAGSPEFHRGIDIAAAAGTPVLAPATGVVRFAGFTPAGGGTVSIALETGYRVTLLQLTDVRVHQGAEVRAGEELGLVASSGDRSSSAPHVHLGLVGPDGRYRDPLGLLSCAAASEPKDARHDDAASRLEAERSGGVGAGIQPSRDALSVASRAPDSLARSPEPARARERQAVRSTSALVAPSANPRASADRTRVPTSAPARRFAVATTPREPARIGEESGGRPSSGTEASRLAPSRTARSGTAGAQAPPRQRSSSRCPSGREKEALRGLSTERGESRGRRGRADEVAAGAVATLALALAARECAALAARGGGGRAPELVARPAH